MGGGGDGGYLERQQTQDRQKAQARQALNANFGVGPTAGTSLVNRNDFYVATPVAGASNSATGEYNFDGAGSGGSGYSTTFDQAGYDKALADEAAIGGQAATNKAALDQLYGGVRTNAFTAGKTRIDEQNTNAARDLKFELFSRGLNGGRVDIDQNALRERTLTQGLSDLGARADQTATQLRTNDEATRLGLLQSIDNGMDQGSAISSALAQMKNNSDKAASEAQGMNLGDLFGTAGLLYQDARRARGQQTGVDQWNYYSGNTGGRSSGGNRTGTSSRAYDGGPG